MVRHFTNQQSIIDIRDEIINDNTHVHNLCHEPFTLLYNKIKMRRINIQNTQQIQENTFQLDKTGQNAQNFEKIRFFNLHTIKIEKQLIDLACVS